MKLGLKGLAMSALVLAASTPVLAGNPPRTIEMTVTKEGFVPAAVNVRKGEALRLVVTRKVERTCATEIVVQGYGIQKDLPLNQPVAIEFTPTNSGTVRYACSMGMIGGKLFVD